MKQSFRRFPRARPYLGVQRWRLEAELVNVGEKRPVQLLPGRRHIQAAPPLLLRHNLCIAGGRYVGTGLAKG